MENVNLTVNTVVYFLVRIGMPVLLLITLGTFIERWQVRRERGFRRQYSSND